MAARGTGADVRDPYGWGFVAGRGAAGAAADEIVRQTLRQLGYVEGQNIGIELRYARGGLQQLPALAAELVGLKPDVLFAPGDLAPKIAQQATSTIPIVAMSDDILGAGLVASLSHPGATQPA